ncbi:hypothetical protein J7413_12300 [Shimia sp. R10_1]|uniref:hypothetical protein n=1 Tax=Shimia sp. R10_1 TaxID=2821095 RepID=UPI001ADC8320|nr:hypothetical protein [Shimia sp. R10_1]MBO9474324.1 hypothetical protein [Shimia sp. R10_1]
MMTGDEIDAKVAQLLDLAREKYGVRAKTLERAMRKIGRRAPKRLHRQAEVIAQAHKVGHHPKLMVQVDGAAVTRAFGEIEAHLAAIDVGRRRVDRILDVLGSVSFNLILFTACLVVFLRWHEVF